MQKWAICGFWTLVHFHNIQRQLSGPGHATWLSLGLCWYEGTQATHRLKEEVTQQVLLASACRKDGLWGSVSCPLPFHKGTHKPLLPPSHEPLPVPSPALWSHSAYEIQYAYYVCILCCLAVRGFWSVVGKSRNFVQFYCKALANGETKKKSWLKGAM